MNLFKIMRALHEIPEVQFHQSEIRRMSAPNIIVNTFIIDKDDTDIYIHRHSNGELWMHNLFKHWVLEDVDEGTLIEILRTAQEKDWDAASLAVLFGMQFSKDTES